MINLPLEITFHLFFGWGQGVMERGEGGFLVRENIGRLLLLLCFAKFNLKFQGRIRAGIFENLGNVLFTSTNFFGEQFFFCFIFIRFCK